MLGKQSIIVLLFCLLSMNSYAQEKGQDKKILPGMTDLPTGELKLEEYENVSNPEVFKGLISVPENRQGSNSRNIGLVFYQIKAFEPSKLPPVVFLPGGPGGFYNDNWVNELNNQSRSSGSVFEALTYLKTRDVILINQRGARSPDASYRMFNFFGKGGSVDKPLSPESKMQSVKEAMKRSVKNWTDRGMDVAGYDIANMIEDINDIRNALGYEKLVMRGQSFGSQWSMSFMRQYPENVDRAILTGVEPIDYGYDSPEGIWNVFKRLEAQIESSRAEQELDYPKVKLTDAIRQVVERLEASPVDVEVDMGSGKQTIPIGAADFQAYLRSGIDERRGSQQALQSLPRFVYEVYNGEYRFLAAKSLKDRPRFIASSMQGLLIDNSLGINKDRDEKLDNEPAKKWLGELNLFYKATRDVTPTPVVSDDFRKLETKIPVLMIQGDHDLSTPIENAEELSPSLPNSHMIRIQRGTHSAMNEIQRSEEKFMSHVEKFLNAPLATEKEIEDVFATIPNEFALPKLKFRPLTTNSLYDELQDK